MDEYSGMYEIRWSDLDANGHVNYAAYIDAAGDLRYRFFSQHGFPPEEFLKLGMGPIYTAIHAQFLREVRMGETREDHVRAGRAFGARRALESPPRRAQAEWQAGSQHRYRGGIIGPCRAQAGPAADRIGASLRFDPTHGGVEVLSDSMRPR